MRKGGKPSFSTYEICAPSCRKASTKTPMGRFFIRSLPVMTCVPSLTANNAVEKRIAVPAAPISMVSGRFFSHACITRVSSQSLTFSTVPSQPASALMVNARLLILFEEGSTTLPLNSLGAITFICIIHLRLFSSPLPHPLQLFCKGTNFLSHLMNMSPPFFRINEAPHRKASFVYLLCFVTNPEMASTPGGLAMTLPSGLTRR